jgi:hypothetical protein
MHHTRTGGRQGQRARRATWRARVVGAVVAVAAAPVLGAGAVTAAPRPAEAIPDTGLPAEVQPVSMSSRSEVLAAGVTGVSTVGDSEPQLQTPVLAFAEWGDVMFVGGKFTQVVRADGTTVAQSSLAAFDRRTGAFVESFRPVLDGAVWDLAVADGKLLVGGQFLSVNGVAGTTALAALDLTTGAVVPGWRANIGITGTTQRPMVRAIDVEGAWAYVGGSFTRVTGLDGVERSAGQLTKVAVSNGARNASFVPNVTGRVYDIDATPTKVWVVGKFTAVNGVARSMVAGLFPSNGAVDTALKQKVDADYRPAWTYQQAVLAVGDEVWITGSQHSTQVYRASDFSLIRAFGSVPWGDGQALARVGDIVFNGSHATDGTKMYFDVPSPLYTGQWNTKGTTGSAPVKWIGAWDVGGDHSFRTDWYTQVGTQFGEGAWELTGDADGCLWAGGDFNRGSFDGNTPRFAAGFVKFCPSDSTPPTVPTNVTVSEKADGIQLVWPASTDDQPGPITYDVFRDDALLASGLIYRTFLDPAGTAASRYFVRAVDRTGNRSATTAVLRVPGDTAKPTPPEDLAAVANADGTVTATWTASTDNVGVTGYAVYRNGVELLQVPGTAATVTGLAAGTHYLQVQALDEAGNRSAKTPSVSVTIAAAGADTTKPTTPKNVAATAQPNGDVAVTWTAATDDVGVVTNVVFANGVEITRVPGTSATVTGLAAGTWSIQVQAVDRAGNGGNRSAPVSVVVAPVGPDTTKPTTPKNLAATLQPNGDVALTWTAATDDVGVTGYTVYRNGVEVLTVRSTSATVTGLGSGSHSLQVQAFDAAGNRGNKTSPITVVK